MSVGDKSRYNYSAKIRVVNSAGYLIEREHLDLRPRLQRTLHSSNIQYPTNKTDNWSRISWRMLGNGRFWWIIADYSQIIDPLSELYPEEKTRYLTQLDANLLAGERTSAIVKQTKRIKRGMVLRIEDLDPGGAMNSVDVSVLTVNATTGEITFPPITVPGGGVPSLLSRVSEVYESAVLLTIPAADKALFQAMDFGNPLNVLVD